MSDYYFVDAAGNRSGPVSAEELHARRTRGEIQDQTSVWKEGWSTWQDYIAAFPKRAAPPPLPGVTARSRYSTPLGVALLSLAIIVLGLGAWDLASAYAAFTGGEPAVEPPKSLRYVILILGITGFAISLGFWVARKVRPALAVAAFLCNCLVLFLCAAGAVASLGVRVREQVIEGGWEGSAESREIAPITVNTNRYRGSERMQAQIRWHQRHFNEQWLERGATNAVWAADVPEYLELALSGRFRTLMSDPWDRLHALQRRLQRAGCNEPRVVLARNGDGIDSFQLPTILEAVRAELEKESDADALRFLCGKLLASANVTSRRGANRVSEADEYTLRALDAALKAGAYRSNEWTTLSYHLASVGGEGLIERKGDRVVRLLEQAEGVPEWLVQRWRGAWELKLAWRARGGGYANTVKDGGWDKFFEHSELARQALERSWELEPTLPFASADLAYAMLGMGEYEDMRLWFDRAIAAEFDYEQPYRQLLWGLRPRWHGSHEDMIAFGRACLATGQFDTEVPWQLHTATWDVISETKDFRKAHEDENLFQELVRVYDGYEQFQANPALKLRQRTRKLAAAVAGRHWEEARDFLRAAGTQLPADALRPFGYQPLDLAVLALSRGQSSGNPLAEAARLRKRGQFDAAREKLREARSSAGDDRELMSPWIEALDEIAQRERVAAAGESISLLEASSPHLWDDWPGDVAYPTNHLLRIPGAMQARALISRLVAGDIVELSGEFQVEPADRDFAVTFHFGNHYSDDSQLLSLHLKHAEIDRLELAQGWRNPFHSSPVNLQPRNRFRLTFERDRVFLELNGKEVLESPILPAGLRNFDRPTVGVSVWNAPEHPAVIFTELELRRAPAKSP